MTQRYNNYLYSYTGIIKTVSKSKLQLLNYVAFTLSLPILIPHQYNLRNHFNLITWFTYQDSAPFVQGPYRVSLHHTPCVNIVPHYKIMKNILKHIVI